MSECRNEGASCKGCGNKEEAMGVKKAPMNSLSKVKKVIGVLSGKGGVGKSAISALLASAAQRLGYKTAILDADITGPSIPKAFGLKERAKGDEKMIFPVITKSGIKIMSINLLLEHETDPVLWRGPLLIGIIEQFWSDVVWGDIDYMFIDMPPGTADVALTVFQSLPVDGLVIITSPQELVAMIVQKAAKMAKMMNVPIACIIENMAYFKCPDCGKAHNIFGKSHIKEVAEKFGIKNALRLPFDENIAKSCDSGQIDKINYPELNNLIKAL